MLAKCFLNNGARTALCIPSLCLFIVIAETQRLNINANAAFKQFSWSWCWKSRACLSTMAYSNSSSAKILKFNPVIVDERGILKLLTCISASGFHHICCWKNIQVPELMCTEWVDNLGTDKGQRDFHVHTCDSLMNCMHLSEVKVKRWFTGTVFKPDFCGPLVLSTVSQERCL